MVENFVIWLDLYFSLVHFSISIKQIQLQENRIDAAKFISNSLVSRGIRNLTKKDKFFPFSSSTVICVKCTEEIPVAETANECVIITGSQHC